RTAFDSTSPRRLPHFSRARSIPYAANASINPIRANQPSGSSAYASNQQINNTVPVNPKIDDATQFTAPVTTRVPDTTPSLLFEDFIPRVLFGPTTPQGWTLQEVASLVPKWEPRHSGLWKNTNYFIFNKIRIVGLLCHAPTTSPQSSNVAIRLDSLYSPPG